MNPLTKLLIFTLLLLLAIGCTNSSSDDSSDGQSASSGNGSACATLNARIFNGETCNSSASSAVVSVVPVAFGQEQNRILGFCTGTFVTADDLVTSAHCFTRTLIQAVEEGITDLTFVAVTGGDDAEAIFLNRVEIHPEYNGVAASRFDVAMATVDRIPAARFSPVPLLISETLETGDQISSFGYGSDERGELGRLKADNFVVSGFSAGNILVNGDGDSSICRGDSGGPAIFVTEGGVSALVGINSFVAAGSCTDAPAAFSGFVDLQDESVLRFITTYAPDVPAA